jgi:hypothetical protein
MVADAVGVGVADTAAIRLERQIRKIMRRTEAMAMCASWTGRMDESA